MEQEPQVRQQSAIFVLVSKLDPSCQPVLFFPYPASVQRQRPCPAGYEGKWPALQPAMPPTR
jgi:hypothetical protein